MLPERNGSFTPENIDANRLKDPEITASQSSTALAQELVEKIKTGEELDLNTYQRSCKYALLYRKNMSFESPWKIGHLDGFLKFYKELPLAVDKYGDKNTEVVFCGSKHDSDITGDLEKKKRDSVIIKTYSTPDGIIYKKKPSTQTLLQIVERIST